MSDVTLPTGANAPLTGDRAEVSIGWGSTDVVDVSAVLLTDAHKVRTDEDLVFFNNPVGGDGAVRTAAGPSGTTHVSVELAKLPAEIARVVVVVSSDADRPGMTLGQVPGLGAVTVSGDARIGYTPDAFAGGETVAVLVELYRRGDAWKVRAVGQGYASGLAGLATDFGISVEDEPDPEPVPAPAAPAHVMVKEPAAAPAPAAPAPISMAKEPLGRVDLAKGGRATINMDKGDRSVTVTASLVWDGGDDARRKTGADLDLYALFVPRSEVGAKKGGGDGVIYYRELGSLTAAPYIQLDGDSRVPGRETVRITRPDEQGYVLICAYSAVENGFGSFKSYGAHAEVTDGQGSTVNVPLFNNKRAVFWVAIALVDFTDPDGVSIQHVEKYSKLMQERRPMLYSDGTFEMGAGPAEFKTVRAPRER
ncbi:TerD family protein [Embleya scabrispora]|uniref:TerD family protein n=1 Tax=Embleya scabrispora TaxID=159449 RepID=UPI000380C048|nr:TerD family protein [Embleya scabrispora]MYS81225.1 Tellurium resistance protein [Streptomyces sp. SID5474]